MGPAYYVIAILGCSDGAMDCARVATVPTRYESEAACSAATMPALAERSDFDFPTMLAECRAVTQPVATTHERPALTPANAAHG